MLKRIVTLIVLIPVAIVLIVLSVANRQDVTLALNPFDPADRVLSVSGPFFMFLFIAVMAGMVLGSAATWIRQGKYRAKARSKSREAAKWHTEADRLKAGPPAQQSAQSSAPALAGPGSGRS